MNRRIGLVQKDDEKVQHEKVDAEAEEKDEVGSDVWMGLRQGLVNGSGFDEVLVNHEVAHGETAEVLVGLAKQVVGEEGEGQAHDERHVEQGHGRVEQANEHQQTSNFAEDYNGTVVGGGVGERITMILVFIINL